MLTEFPNGLDESSNLTGVMDIGVAFLVAMVVSSFGMRVGVVGGHEGVDEADTGSGVATVSGSRHGVGTGRTVMIDWSGDGT